MNIARITASLGPLTQGPVASGALISIAVRIAALGLGFLQAVLTARLLGPEGYGIVAVALSVATLAATLAALGFGPLAVREVARLSTRMDWPELGGFLKFSSLTVFIASIVGSVVIGAVALKTEAFDPTFRLEIAVAALLVLPLSALIYIRGVLQGFGQVLAAQVPGDLLRPLVLLGGLSLFVVASWQATTVNYLVVTIVAAGIAAIVATVVCWRTASVHFSTASLVSPGRHWAGAASPFLAMALLGALGGEVNTLLLGWFAGPAEAGLFQPVARIAPILLIALQAVAVPFAPRIATLWEQGEIDRLHKTTWLVTLTTTGATIVICTAVVVAGPVILSAFGKAFVMAAGTLFIVAIAQVFNSACGPVGMLLSMTGYQGVVVRGQIAGLTANLLLGFWLIPDAGVTGAALAFAGNVVVWNLFMLAAVKRILGFDASIFGARHLVTSPTETEK